MASIKYRGPSGREMDLTEKGNWHRSIAYGGLSGMVGQVTTSTVTAVGVAGTTPTSHQTKDMTGELTLLIFEHPGSPTVDESVAEIRQEFHATRYGYLRLQPRDGAPWLSTRVRLNGRINPPPAFLEDEADAEVMVPIIADGGLWTQDAVTKTGTVTVTNAGDAFMWPTLVITGPGTITLPSGTKYTLPAPGSATTVSLDPHTSHEAVRPTGQINDALTAVTKDLWLGEGVPEQTSRTYTTTGGVALRWAQQYRDPWR